MLPNCSCDGRTHYGSFPLFVPHFSDCVHFGPTLRDLLEALVRGIETWSSEEDGVHPDCWSAYERAKLAIGDPVKLSESPMC